MFCQHQDSAGYKLTCEENSQVFLWTSSSSTLPTFMVKPYISLAWLVLCDRLGCFNSPLPLQTNRFRDTEQKSV